MSNSSSSFTVEEVVRKEVPDWDDDVASTARFKALTGQRSDWEPKLRFWSDLIIKVARHQGTCTVRSFEVKSVWFARGGLTPLCMDQVLHEMRTNGDILSQGDLIDPTSGRLYQIFRRAGQLLGSFRSLSLQANPEDTLILKTLLQERAADIIKNLTDCNWTSSCIITLHKFQSICKCSDEASAILSYLSECGKARYFSIGKKDLIEGVKLSLVSSSVPSVSRLDYDTLHLIWTVEKLQQQLDIIDHRLGNAKKLALASLKLGNKQVAYRHIRQAKLFSESRANCTSLLERVEEVLRVIADAESTRKVSEAIQIGAHAIKENRISIEEVHIHLQELEENMTAQKLVNEALEATPIHSVNFEDEEMEEEFNKLEVELADEMPIAPVTRSDQVKEQTQESAELLSQALSNLNLQPEAA